MSLPYPRACAFIRGELPRPSSWGTTPVLGAPAQYLASSPRSTSSSMSGERLKRSPPWTTR